MVACKASFDKAEKHRQRLIASGKTNVPERQELTPLDFWLVALGAAASLKVDEISYWPAPRFAWDVSKTSAAEAKREAYWSAWDKWDGHSDPPEGLPRFDLTIVLVDAKWMPSAWPKGIAGTAAYAKS